MEQVIKEVLSEYEIEQDFTKETPLYELGISSIMVLEMIVMFEEKFEFTFDDDDLIQENFESIGSLINLLQKYIEQKD